MRDRIVQGALRHVMEPIFERDFAPHSYGFRPGEDARTRCAESMNCSRAVHTGWWMRI